ncbi:MAG: hypothetical protein QOH64_284 [Acidimicrobiaceae bacterium]|jgi:uncharacterized YccA/Bax inhibitor family protein
MPNPTLNEKVFQREAGGELRDGWAAPDRPIPAAPDTVSPWTPAPPKTTGDGEVMTVRGIASATGVLLALLLVGAAVGWAQVTVKTIGEGRLQQVTADIPPLLLPALLVGLAFAIATIFRPRWARVTAPLYALAEGLVVGIISHVYEAEFSGIVLQAVGLTVAVFLFMLVMFATGRIQVTDKLRVMIMASTAAIFVVYLLSMVARLFGGDVPFIHDSGTFGIVFSLLVVGVASMNLLLDFDFCQRAVAARAPKHMEWYAAFGLLVTLVWLYLELLRLLSKLRSR